MRTVFLARMLLAQMIHVSLCTALAAGVLTPSEAEVHRQYRDEILGAMPRTMQVLGSLNLLHPGAEKLVRDPKSGLVASVETRGFVAVWDEASGDLQRFYKTAKPIVGTGWLGGGKELVVAQVDGLCRVLNWRSGTERQERIGPDYKDTQITEWRGQLICLGWGGGQSIEVWGGSPLRKVHTIESTTGDIVSFSLSRDGRRLAYCSKTTVTLIDLETRRHYARTPLCPVDPPKAPPMGLLDIPSVPQISECKCLAFSDDSKVVAVGLSDGPISLLDVSTGKEIRRLGRAPSPDMAAFPLGCDNLTFSPDGTLLGGGGMCLGTRVWRVRDGKELAAPQLRSVALVFSYDNLSVLLIDNGTNLLLWDVAADKPSMRVHRHHAPVYALEHNDRGGHLVSLDADSGVKVWNLAEKRLINEWQGERGDSPGWCQSLVMADDESFLWAPDSVMLQRKNWKTGRILSRQGDPAVPISSFTRCPDTGAVVIEQQESALKRRLSVLGTNKALVAIDPEDRVELAPVLAYFGGNPGINPNSSMLSIAPGGQLLAFCQGDPALRIYSMENGKQLHRLLVGGAPLSCCRFAPNGRFVAAGGGGLPRSGDPVDCRLRIWDAHSGQELWKSDEQRWMVQALDWAPAGEFVASASLTTVRIWETISGQEVLCHSGGGRIRSLRFDPKGRSLYSGRENGLILVWDFLADEEERPLVPDIAQAWRTLADADARKAFQAQRELVRAGENGVSYLRERLTPAPRLSREHLEKMIEQLGSSSFEEREQATKQLLGNGQAAPLLVQTIRQSNSLEQRRRAEAVLRQANAMVVEDMEERRVIRAILVLGWIGTPDAAVLLARLGEGAPNERRTEAALSALRVLRGADNAAKIKGR